MRNKILRQIVVVIIGENQSQNDTKTPQTDRVGDENEDIFPEIFDLVSKHQTKTVVLFNIEQVIRHTTHNMEEKNKKMHQLSSMIQLDK